MTAKAQQVRRVMIYARISVTNEESVSIARQIESCQKYTDSRKWEVVHIFEEDGVSATKNKPEDRKAWRALLADERSFDAVIVWKVDRLARRVLDFLHADEALRARKAGIVSVEDPIDMTTAQGRAFATMLAVFGEMEAAVISARVKGARRFLIKAGRVVGGTVPYGFKSVPNPDGPGFVLVQDPVTIDYVRAMVDRIIDGYSIYSVQKWLDDVGAPLPTTSQKRRKKTGWHYSTVERILRSPVLAGMASFNPGNDSKTRGDNVLRDDNGMPVIDESVAILTTDERRKLMALLDDRDSPQARPLSSKAKTSPLLSGLVECGHCQVKMYRGTTAGRPALTCPQCHQTVTTTQLVPHLEAELLAERGESPIYETETMTEDNRADLADIEEAISDVLREMTADDADMATLSDQLHALKELRTKTRNATPTERRYLVQNRTVADEWQAADDDVARRAVLIGQVAKIVLVKGKTGRYLDKARVTIEWKDAPTLADVIPDRSFSSFKLRVDQGRTIYDLEASQKRA